MNSLKGMLTTSILLVFVGMVGSAQPQQWLVQTYTKHVYKLDFRLPNPAPFLVTSLPLQGYNDEVVDLITDHAGEVAFMFTIGSSNGEVLDKNYQTMPNGSGLIHYGDNSESLIFQDPGDTLRYYIFHYGLGSAGLGGLSYLYYSIVDLSLPGFGTTANPRGEVSVKSQLVLEKMTEGITASNPDSLGNRWVFVVQNPRTILTQRDSFDLIGFKVTASGINPPVVFDRFPITGGFVYELEVSPDNQKIALTTYQQPNSQNYDLFVWEFQYCPLRLSERKGYFLPGKRVTVLEFSPDSEKIYWMSNHGMAQGQLGRLNLSTGINDLISNNIGVQGKKIETAPDGKLYIAVRNQTLLQCISNPNHPDINSIGFGSGNISFPSPLIFGLPNSVSDIPLFPISEALSFQIIAHSPICDGDTNGVLEITGLQGEPPFQILWSTGDTSMNLNNLHSGNYWVSVLDGNGCTRIDTIFLSAAGELPVFAFSDTTVIAGSPVQLFATGAVNYTWSGSGDFDCMQCPNPVVTAFETGPIWVTGIDDNGCVGWDSVFITVLLQPESMDCGRIITPTAFSPNSDGRNDFLKLFQTGRAELINFSVFNRWGELVWQTNNIHHQWDGYYRETPQILSSFVYVLEYKCDEKQTQEAGTITLIR